MSVYIIQAGETPFVKIGHGDVKARLNVLQIGHYEVLHVIRTVPGEANTEAQFHTEFRRYHHRREWYRFCDEMLTFQPEPEPPPFPDEIAGLEALAASLRHQLAKVERELEWKEAARRDWANIDWGGSDDDDDPDNGDLIAF